MKIKLIAIGKTDESYLTTGIEKYLNRLKHYISIELIILPDVKQGIKPNIEKTKDEEAKLFLQKIAPNDWLVLLDEHGKSLSSENFAVFLQKKMNSNPNHLIFLIGGPFGFSDSIYQRANEQIALSAMTFSHQMVRLFFLEQLYRGFTIIKGEKYHHS